VSPFADSVAALFAAGASAIAVFAWFCALRKPVPTRRVSALRVRQDKTPNHSSSRAGFHWPNSRRIPGRLRFALLGSVSFICVQMVLSLLLSIVLVGGLLGGYRSWRSFKQARHHRNLAATLIPFVEHLSRSLRSGESPVAALESAGRSQQLQASFAALSSDCRSGRGFSSALLHWESQQPSALARQLSQTLRLGDSLGAVRPQFVDSVLMTLLEQQNLAAEVRALSDQARYSAAVMVGAPLLFCVALVTTDSDARRLLLHTNLGGFLLVVGAGLDLAGFRWMQRLTRRVGDS
jgi:Flp pilus assembly protein TadB